MLFGWGEANWNGADERDAEPLLGVKGVIGEAGAFINRPPHRLQVDEPDGLWPMPPTALRALPSRPYRRG